VSAPLFDLPEYARAEASFVHETLHALAKARDGLYGQISTAPAQRIGTTQITTDEGVVVEQEPMEVRTKLSIQTDDLVAGRIEPLLGAFDEAAESFLDSLMPQVFEALARVSEATGNVVDAKDRPIFDAFYEMFEKVELRFSEEGQIDGSALVVNPEDWKKIEADQANWSPEQHRKLQELIERKRETFNAERRHRRLPRIS
jgi:hypothetical protein